jgi:hypothetical protein
MGWLALAHAGVARAASAQSTATVAWHSRSMERAVLIDGSPVDERHRDQVLHHLYTTGIMPLHKKLDKTAGR